MPDPTPPIVDKQLIDISLSGGVNERERPEVMDWTKGLATAENVTLVDGGALTAKPGSINIGLTDDASANYYPVYRLLPQERGLAFVGKDWSLYDLNESDQFPVGKGRLPEFSVTHRGMSSWGVDSRNELRLAGYTSKYVVLVHCSSLTGLTDRNWTVVVADKNSDNIVRKYTVTATAAGASAQLAACVSGDYLHVMSSIAGPSVGHGVLDLSGTLPPDSASLSTSASATGWTVASMTYGSPGMPIFTGIVATTGGGCFCAQTDGTSTYLETFDSAGVSTGTATLANFYGTGASCTNGSDVYICGVKNTPRLALKVVTASTLATSRTVATTVVATGAETTRVIDDGSGNCRILWYQRSAVGGGVLYNPGPWVFSCASAATDYTYLSFRPLYHWLEASQPFYSASTGRFYVALAKQLSGSSGAALTRDTSTGGTVAVIDITEGYSSLYGSGVKLFRPCAVADTYTAYIGNNNQDYGYCVSGSIMTCPPTVMVDTYKVYLGVQQRVGAQAFSYSVAEMGIRRSEMVGCDKDVIASSVLTSYDGDAPAEVGFLDTPSVFLANAGAGTVDTGVHNYVAVLEYRDMRGQSHFSRMSRPATLTLGAGSNVTVTIPLTSVSSHDAFKPRGGVQAHVYRTVAGGVVYYYVGTINTYMSQSLTDSTTDAALVANAQPFRQPGINGTPLDRFNPLAASCVVRHKDRVFYANGSNVYYSSFAIDGEAPWFNPSFSFSIPGGQGPVTALASMDGALVVFKSDSIFVVDGDGPPENGGNGTEFSPPRRILTEFGCPDARMLVATPNGLMFRSRRGIELLDRSLQVSWIGARVSATCDAYPKNGGCAFDSTTGRVLFSVASSVQDDSVVSHTYASRFLVYDVDANGWTVWNPIMEATAANNGVQDVGACVTTVSGDTKRRVFYTTEYYPAYLDSSTSLDVGYYSDITIETGWVKLDSAQGRIRVSDFLFLGKKMDNHKLTISVAYDYSSSYSYSKSWEPDVINALGIEQLELEVPYPARMAAKFKVVITSPTDTVTYPVTTGRGATILALSPRVGRRGGQNKVASTQKG